MNTIIGSNTFNELNDNIFVTDDYIKLLRKRRLNNSTIFVTNKISDFNSIQKYKKNYFIRPEDIDMSKEWTFHPSNQHECIISSGDITIRLEPYFKYAIFKGSEFQKVHYYYYSDETNKNINEIKKDFYSNFKLGVPKKNEILNYEVPGVLLRKLINGLTSPDTYYMRKYKNNILFFYKYTDSNIFISACSPTPVKIDNDGIFDTLNFGLYIGNKYLNIIDTYLLTYHFKSRLEAYPLLKGYDKNEIKKHMQEYMDRISLKVKTGLIDGQ